MLHHVLDSSVLLNSGGKILRSYGPEDLVIIPLIALYELDRAVERGVNGASDVLRSVDAWLDCGDACGRIVEGHREQSALNVAMNRMSSGSEDRGRVALVTDKVHDKVLARIAGLDLVDWDAGVGYGGLGVREVEVSWEILDEFFEAGKVRLEGEFAANQNLILKSGNASGLAVAGTGWDVVRVEDGGVLGVFPKNAEQRFALHHLRNESAGVVSLGGVAGSGKSLLSLCVGIDRLRRGLARKIEVYRPSIEVQGGSLGYLPGTEAEKFGGFSRAVGDALEIFLSSAEVKDLTRSGKLEVLPLTHLRGRTLNGTWIVLDECQNVPYETIHTVLSRAGKGSKVVLCGDTSQSDNWRVGKDQGISRVVKKLSGHPLFASVTFTKSERSEVAKMVADLLT